LLDTHRADAARRLVALMVEGFDPRDLAVLVVEREHPAFRELGGALHVASAAEIASRLERFDETRAAWLRSTGTDVAGHVRFAVLEAAGSTSVGAFDALEMTEA